MSAADPSEPRPYFRGKAVASYGDAPPAGGVPDFDLGDLADAVRLYPLGPLLFAGTLAGVAGLVAGALTGRTWVPRLNSPPHRVNLLSRGWRELGVSAVYSPSMFGAQGVWLYVLQFGA